MELFLKIYDTVVVALVVMGQVGIVALLLALIFRSRLPEKVHTFIIRYAFPFSAMVATVAMLGSLGYSDIFLYQPCKLCWYQRIFMYPQVLLLWLAHIRKEYVIRMYSLIMVGVGALIALYHYLMQFSVVPSTNCTTVGYSASCSEYFTAHLGYITIPMMALTAFLLILVTLVYFHYGVSRSS